LLNAAVRVVELPKVIVVAPGAKLVICGGLAISKEPVGVSVVAMPPPEICKGMLTLEPRAPVTFPVTVMGE
jgi:hypothetical protein